MTRLHTFAGRIFSLAMVATLICQCHADSTCTSFASVFNLTDSDSTATGPVGQLAVHTLLMFNRTESTVYLSITFLQASLPVNASYHLSVDSSSQAGFEVPGGVGGNFSIQLPPDGNGNVTLNLYYDYIEVDKDDASKNITFAWTTSPLDVSFTNWVPFTDALGSGASNYICVLGYSANSTSGTGRQRSLSSCLCCNIDNGIRADIFTCPIANIVTSTAANNGDGTDGGQPDHSACPPSLVGYLFSLCLVISLLSLFSSGKWGM